ncbi:PaaX family transcriptional regulator C-terminal domain-containing protein [Streptomyces hydrogenans]|uniref:PaaX family transcriptional regulator n=1 Tax=Streptomyces hydrogenans TaxID=1873719 RepID=UPI00345C917F
MENDDVLDPAEGPQQRPQSLMLAFFGNHVLEEGDLCVSSGSVIDVLGRMGVGEQAVRSTLTRMVNRGLLSRQREGRRMYFGLTPHARRILEDGHARIWTRGAVDDAWDGTWTLVGFSLPESWRRERHDLRSRLVWAGFGPLQSGLWAAPGRVDVTPVAAELGLGDRIRAFHGQAAAPTGAGPLLRTAFDLDAIAADYRAFLARWSGDGPAPADAHDDLGRQLLLHTDWLELVRRDPYLPAEHLPADWPAEDAERTFRTLSKRYEPGARHTAETLLDRWDPKD